MPPYSRRTLIEGPPNASPPRKQTTKPRAVPAVESFGGILARAIHRALSSHESLRVSFGRRRASAAAGIPPSPGWAPVSGDGPGLAGSKRLVELVRRFAERFGPREPAGEAGEGKVTPLRPEDRPGESEKGEGSKARPGARDNGTEG